VVKKKKVLQVVVQGFSPSGIRYTRHTYTPTAFNQ
jgi:hypothetical protein